jgi:hypothetical protein
VGRITPQQCAIDIEYDHLYSTHHIVELQSGFRSARAKVVAEVHSI